LSQKLNNRIIIDFEPISRRVYLQEDKTLYEILTNLNIPIQTICGGSGTCGKCIDRCPVEAIDEKGHNKTRCREYVYGMAAKYVLTNYGIQANCCGLCQTGIPCESKIPTKYDVK